MTPERLAEIRSQVEAASRRMAHLGVALGSSDGSLDWCAELLAEVERLTELLRHVVTLAADGEHPQPNSKCQWCQQIMAEGRQG